MSAPVVLRAFDLAVAPDRELRRIHAVIGDDDRPFEAWLVEERRLDLTLDMVRVAAERTADDELVGYGRLELDRHANTHVGWAFIAVAEAHRRNGIGTQVLRHLVDVASGDGRRSLGINADEGSSGERFVAGVGLTRRNTAHQNRLRIAEVDVAMLDEWIERASERAGGYRLRFWEGPTPDDVAEDFAVCHDVMNSAPRGDLDLVDERMTVDRLHTLEAGRAAVGTEWWTLVAVEEATGALAGFTQLSFPSGRPTVARQNDTGVDPAHRERGLGRWLKADMLRRVLATKPAIELVETWNAGSNAPMLAINHALGFRLAKVSGNWQADLDVVRKQLGARS